MKRSLPRRLAAILCLSACLLCACAGSGTALTYGDGAYRSRDGKTAYLEAPVTYYALSALTDKTVATINRTGASDIPLYAIEGAEKSRYLTDGDLMLYYAEGTTLPTLAELGATKLTLYAYAENRTGRKPMATLTNQEQVADLVRRATEDEKIPAHSITAELYHRMELLFTAEGNTAFGIMLEYRKFSVDIDGHGMNFIYDRITRTYTPVGDVLENYFIGDEETGTSENT